MKKKLAVLLSGAAIGLTLGVAQAQAASYTVQPGDYLWKIAVANETTVEQLMNDNHLASYDLYPGQVLQVPDLKDRYTVQYGDVLWKIAAKFGIGMDKLIAANPQLTNPNNIWPGLKLVIPEKPPAFADGVFPLKKAAYSPLTDNYEEARAWSASAPAQRSHEGVDVFADKGTPVYSAMDGTIVRKGWNEYGGWRLTVTADQDTEFYYAHLSKYADGISEGGQVKKGQLIGYVGNTGYGPVGTEGKFLPHLHFGIYKVNPWHAIDPFVYLKWWELSQ